jgi:quercetin dioxygenase-like cupin family protein
MTNMNRRDVCTALSSLAALAAALPASGQAASTTAVPPPDAPLLSTQRTFRFDELPVKDGPNGQSRAVLHGVLPTGESIELHETTLLPGHMPHPPHKHRHSELMMIREGSLEFDNDGTKERVGPGGVIFAASNVTHGLKNICETNANYFVVAIGHE